jgi:hypothetical protein
MDLRAAEFTALRGAISSRGTARIVIAAGVFIAWSSLTTLLALFSDLPLAVLIPFVVLIAGFEAVHALHAGAERIGRYVQVYYESETGGGPRWETTAMAVGPALPGGGVDPLFSVLFAGAAVVNAAAALPIAPIWQEMAVIGILHATFLVRIVRARSAAGRQRSVELERFKTVLLREHDRR